MKKNLILFLLILINPLSAGITKTFSIDSLQVTKKLSYPAGKDNWLAKDKGMHFVGSFIVSGVTTLSLKRFAGYSNIKSVNIGVTFSVGLGFIKEIYDGQQEKNRFSYKDLTADVLGCFLAYFVFN